MDLITIFERFGLPVAFLIIMIWLFVKAEEKFVQERKEHRAERAEWRECQDKLQENTNNALKDLTKAITSLEKSHVSHQRDERAADWPKRT